MHETEAQGFGRLVYELARTERRLLALLIRTAKLHDGYRAYVLWIAVERVRTFAECLSATTHASHGVEIMHAVGNVETVLGARTMFDEPSSTGRGSGAEWHRRVIDLMIESEAIAGALVEKPPIFGTVHICSLIRREATKRANLRRVLERVLGAEPRDASARERAK